MKDPETARKLTPNDLYARRPLCSNTYYTTYNRDNVELVDLRENAISEITPTGVVTADGVEHPLDVLTFATGFDAIDGHYRVDGLPGPRGAVHLRALGGRTDQLPRITTAGSPNLFMTLGPNGPFTNLPPSIETQVEWITELIGATVHHGAATAEATAEAEAAWTTTCLEIADMTLFPQIDSWIFGTNVRGKHRAVMFYMAGLGNYRATLADVQAEDYRGFSFSWVAEQTVGISADPDQTRTLLDRGVTGGGNRSYTDLDIAVR